MKYLYVFLLVVSSACAFDQSILPRASDKGAMPFINGKQDSTSWVPKRALFEFVSKELHCEIFVETGTYLGKTTQRASYYFKKVHSIELDKKLFLDAKKKFKKNTKVKLHFGDSTYVLPEVLPTLNAKTCFYLDGHFSEGITALGEKVTPIREELSAIQARGIKNCVILIDDVRHFQISRYHPASPDSNSAYPLLESTIDALLEINPNFKIIFFGDILMAYPEEKNITVSPVQIAMLKQRLFYNELSLMELEMLDRVIAKAPLHEKVQIKEYFDMYGKREMREGLRSYATYWYALGLPESVKMQLLREISTSSRNGWVADR